MRSMISTCFLLAMTITRSVAAQGGTIPNATIPVVGSGPGNLGSFFRTGLQMCTRFNGSYVARLVFHPAGQQASPSDPTFSAVLNHDAVSPYADIVTEMGLTGLGSLDIFVDYPDQLPTIVTRIYNDAGANGTSGFTESLVLSQFHGVVQPARTATLITPPDLDRFRYNIGVRTLSCEMFAGQGCLALYSSTNLFINIYDINGALVRTVEKHFPNDYFIQQSAEEFLEGPIGPNSSFFIYTNAFAVLYGATVDNVTQDPSAQFTPVLGPFNN